VIRNSLADEEVSPMTRAYDSITVLSRALDQTGDVLAGIHREQLSDPTPCADWTVAQLIGHVVSAPRRFLEMAKGGEPDWSSGPEPATEGWTAEFQVAADDLIHAWHEVGDRADAGTVDWQIAEFAVHTWDLVRATGQSPRLDPEVAERGYAFMSVSLTPENRADAFGAEVEVADDADPYDRLAAFAGRDPGV
jgi:uncharacterized protein (TIGR03086 family)